MYDSYSRGFEQKYVRECMWMYECMYVNTLFQLHPLEGECQPGIYVDGIKLNSIF